MVNDVIIIGVIGFFLLSAGVLIPFIQQDLNMTVSENNVSSIMNNDLGSGLNETNYLNAWTFIKSVLKMFFWSFGEFGVIVEVFLTGLRFIFFIAVIRNVWIGGGG